MSKLIALLSPIGSQLMAALAPYLFRLVIAGLITSAIGGAFIFTKVHYEHVGRDKAIAAIAANERETLAEVNAAKQKIDECYARRGTWDASVGVCS